MAPTYLNEMAPFRPFAAKAPCNVGDGINGPPCRMRLRSMPLILLLYPRPPSSPILLQSRHCERSEAIHVATQRKNGLLRRFAPRNDGAQISGTALPSRGLTRVMLQSSAQRNQRAQGMPGARCTRGLVCKDAQKETHTSIQVQRRHSGIPRAMALRLISRSPRRRIRLATVVGGSMALPNPVGFEKPPPT